MDIVRCSWGPSGNPSPVRQRPVICYSGTDTRGPTKVVVHKYIYVDVRDEVDLGSPCKVIESKIAGEAKSRAIV